MHWRGNIAFLLLELSGVILVAGMSDVWVELQAPRFVVHRHSALLRCHHNVNQDSLYKNSFLPRTFRLCNELPGVVFPREYSMGFFKNGVKRFLQSRDARVMPLVLHLPHVVFFKNGQRLMKFVRGRDPPYELYNVTGAEISLIKLTPTSITLERLDFTASGPYACEIALETPLYSKVSKIHELTVIVRQKTRPKIKIKHKKLSPSGHLEATCQSQPAHPAPHLTWLINNMKVDERLTIPHGTVSFRRHQHGMPLSITNSSLHFPLTSLELFPNQTVDITCLSTIPSYAIDEEGFADVQNTTVTVNLVRIEPTPTQLPVKIVSPDLNVSTRCKTRYLLVLLVFVCHLLY